MGPGTGGHDGPRDGGTGGPGKNDVSSHVKVTLAHGVGHAFQGQGRPGGIPHQKALNTRGKDIMPRLPWGVDPMEKYNKVFLGVPMYIILYFWGSGGRSWGAKRCPGYRCARSIENFCRIKMVVARASGMDLASILRQNTFLTLGVRPVGVSGVRAGRGGRGGPGTGGHGGARDGGTRGMRMATRAPDTCSILVGASKGGGKQITPDSCRGRKCHRT